jgi:RND family efflux transporter MFP subunit
METLKPIQTHVPEADVERAARPTERRSGRKSWLLPILILLVACAVVAGIAVKRLGGPVKAPTVAPRSVAVARVTRQDLVAEVPIPAEFRPYVESELHAMVTGYVDKMNVDFGDKVKEGDVLATIEVPELTDELHNAQASEQQAEANYTDAHLIYTRLQTVNQQHPNLVAQQDIDTAQSKDAAAAAAIAAAKADVEKYETLVNYTKIISPFDGVITQRSADPGALVQAGTSSDRSMPLVRVSDNYHLRLDFPVSVDYVNDVHVGDPVTVRVDSLGGKTFTGRITRFTDQVSDDTRTMTTELEVDNPNLEIIPGMYAVAQFDFEKHNNVLAVPTQAISNPKDPAVYVVNSDNAIESRPVTLGIEMPDKYEVTGGLSEGEMVVVGGSSEIHAGEKVTPKFGTESTVQ